MGKALKRSLSLLLAITIIFGSAYVGLSEVDFGSPFAVEAKAATSGTSGDCTWSLDGTVLTISGSGEMNLGLFRPGGHNITEIIIEDGITSICFAAFSDCENLTSVSIPDSVTSIESLAFKNCRNLTSITIGENIKNIGQCAFEDCVLINKVYWNAKTVTDFSEFVTDSAWGLFENCGTSTEGINFVFGDTVERIPARLFEVNYGFTNPKVSSVYIGKNVSQIGEYAFRDSDYLASISVHEGNDKFIILDGILYSKDKTNLILYPCLKSGDKYIIPNSVTSIEKYAFCDCDNLSSITIPDSVTSIGDAAFFSCDKLTSASIPDGISYIGDNLFNGCNSLEYVSIPDSVTRIGSGAFSSCQNLKSIIIPDKVTSIGSSAFYGCSSLGGQFIIPDGVKSIEKYTFAYCEKILSVIIPDSVTSIGDFAFAKSGLGGSKSFPGTHAFTLPDSLVTVGDGVFEGCEGLTTLTFPYSVLKIGRHLFEGCINLKTVTIPCSVEEILYPRYNQDIYHVTLCEKGSVAEKYAIDCRLRYETIEHYENTAHKEKVTEESYTFLVRAKNDIGDEIPAVGAVVTVYNGSEAVFSDKTNDSGVLSITKKELIAEGLNEHSLSNCTVSAHLPVGDDFELCSETVSLDGVWEGADLKPFMELVVDEPRWSPKLRVLVEERNLDKCEDVLREYSNKFAQSTNGHVILNYFEIKVVPNYYSLLPKNNIREITKSDDIDIYMISRNFLFTPFASVLDGYFREDGYAISFGGVNKILCYKEDERYTEDHSCEGEHKIESGLCMWVPINRDDCAEALCHESGHYLLGFKDEYLSAVGEFTGKKEQWKTVAGEPTLGKIDRPDNAPENFGLMENQNSNAEALEMSRESTYANVVTKLTEDDYKTITEEEAKKYTVQYFYSNGSCEEKMADELDRLARDKGGYSTGYSYAKLKLQTAEYWYAGGDYVSFSISYLKDTSTLSISDSVPLQYSSGSGEQGTVSDCRFDYDGSVLNITADTSMNVSITDFDGTEVFSATLNEGNNYTVSFETPIGNCFNVTTTQIVNGETIATEYFLETISVKPNSDFNNESPAVTLFSDNETQAVILYNGEAVTNGEHTSIGGEYIVVADSGSEVTGSLQTSLSYDLDIDYSSVAWFYMSDSEWVALETVYSLDDHSSPNFMCEYAGNGKYCLMAKSANEGLLNTPTGLNVTDEGKTADGEVIVTFTDDNTDVLNYNVYYSTEPITAENYENAERTVVNEGSNQVYITVGDVGSEYYFAVQAIGKTGAKSEISENVSFTSSYTDSDNDGIPNYWFDIYYQLKDVENVANVDSDKDGLTNLEEFQNNTNPLDDDTDDDNVFDGIELENNLNPLEPMTDGVTNDYIVVYGAPDLYVTNISFDAKNVYFDVENKGNGKAMRALVEVTSGDEDVVSWLTNIDSQGSMSFSFKRNLVLGSDGFVITIDGRKATFDSDYSDNVFEYIPATSISLEDVTLDKGLTHSLNVVLQPSNTNEVYNLSYTSANDCITLDSESGVITACAVGEAQIQAETLSGLTAICNITVKPFASSEYPEFECDLINDSTEIAITGYIGGGTHITIPDFINGYPVTQLNENCIPSGVISVTIPATITTIASNAFASETLECIVVDEKNTKYSSVDGVLYNVDKTILLRAPATYTDVVINKAVTTIGDYAFDGCDNLKYVFYSGARSEWLKITVGNNNVLLSKCIFHYNSTDHNYEYKTDVEPTCINEGIKHKECTVCGYRLDDEAIPATGHTYSTEWTIDVPVTCTENGSKSHHCLYCEDKTNVTIIEATGHIMVNEVCYNCGLNDLWEFEKYDYNMGVAGYKGDKTEIELPSTAAGLPVTKICEGAFSGNESLTYIKIPDSVTSIGANAFSNCSALEKVIIPESVTDIGAQAFEGFSGVIYCVNGSVAHKYAVDNNMDFVFGRSIGMADLQVDESNFVIRTDVELCADIPSTIEDMNLTVSVKKASLDCGEMEYYGTGTIISVYSGDYYVGDFTLIVNGDTNGDSVCDALDAAQVALVSNGLKTFDGAYGLAADTNLDEIIDIDDYQAIVNKVVA